jgi:phage recombination protein Bet
MSNVVTLTDAFRPAQIALIQRMNPDCNADEFNQFMHVSASLGLDPLKKQIYAFVFNKDKADKRRMSIVVGIDGFRAVANRSGNYRPDDRAPRITYDESAANPLTNPLGIVSAEVTVYKRVHSEWWPTVAIAYWDEFAPIVTGSADAEDYEWIDTGETWPDTGKPKKRKQLKAGRESAPMLDPHKDNWRKMPRVMISKCAEAQAIRRAWPEDLSSVYEDSEIDRARTIDLTATELAEQASVQDRLERIGGADGIMFDFGDGLERIPLGKAADRIIQHMGEIPAHEVVQWKNLNRVPLTEFWARAKADALEVKKAIEKAEAAVGKESAA